MGLDKTRWTHAEKPHLYGLQLHREQNYPVITRFEEFLDEDKNNLNRIQQMIQLIIGDKPIYVFGSKVKGTWHKDSDYDLFIQHVPTDEQRRAVKNLDFGIRVDRFFSDEMKFNFLKPYVEII